jgi:hypothetical protein
MKISKNLDLITQNKDIFIMMFDIWNKIIFNYKEFNNNFFVCDLLDNK